MLIAGIQRLTLLDFPGHTACTVFTAGCNFRCHYCHNPEMVIPEEIEKIKDSFIPPGAVLNFLKTRKGLLDGVCITGGEPTIMPDLRDFIIKIRELGFKVKLDSNGSNPEIIKGLIDDGLLDYIAMDIKASPANYQKVTNSSIDVSKIEASKKIIMESGLPYEFRSTILPRLHGVEEFKDLVKSIKGCKKYYIQNFRSKGSCINKEFEKESGFIGPELDNLKNYAKEELGNCEVRN